jgi:hypothetical protein
VSHDQLEAAVIKMSHIDIACITTRIEGASDIDTVPSEYNTARRLARGDTMTERDAIDVLILGWGCVGGVVANHQITQLRRRRRLGTLGQDFVRELMGGKWLEGVLVLVAVKEGSSH